MGAYLDIKRAVSDHGFFKGILLWLLSNLVLIITAISSIYSAATIHSIAVNNSNISNVYVGSEVKPSPNPESPKPSPSLLGAVDEVSQIKTFSKDNWIFYDVNRLDQDGFYCPAKQSFPYWNIWTKKRFKLEYSPKITFKIIDKTKDKKPATVFVNYGDKSNVKPDSIFRVHFFDGDFQSIRAYDSKDNAGKLGRDTVQWPIDGEITVSLQPVRPNPQKLQVTLNPSIQMVIDQQEHPFSDELITDVPLVRTENVDGFQYGIGVPWGDCIKIISSNLE